jgi:hypothetical protein
MSEPQALSFPPGHASAIGATMTFDRLERYLAMAGGDLEKTLHLYNRNALLSEAFYIPRQGVEIVIRNALHKQLFKQYGEKWFEALDDQNILDPKNDAATPITLLKIREAREYLKAKKKDETSSRMAAELSFGFWVGLCASRYQATLWNPLLFKPFKGNRLMRAAVYDRLDNIRALRNRIAHHEPILHRDLPADFEKIIETIRWICGASAKWIERTSCFHQRFAAPVFPESDGSNPAA